MEYLLVRDIGCAYFNGCIDFGNTVIDLPVELDEGVKGEKAELNVWNADEWRLVARSEIEGSKVTFKDVGASLPFVLLVSAELDEIMSLSDRIAVMYHGEIMATLDAETAERATLGLLMAGVHPNQ